MPRDARAVKREASGRKAWIRVDGGFSVRPCIVKDISASGVRISIDTPKTVSERFNLLMSRDSGLGQPCRVKWRRGHEIGAEFRK